MVSELTPRQAQILKMIERHMRDTGMPPTRAEIAQALGFRSANAAEEHLRALARKGVIEMHPGTSRGLRLIKRAKEIGVPLVGRVAAGYPILAEQNIEAHYQFDAALFSGRVDYLLKVQGLSMRDAGILDGDWLAVQQRSDAQNGQIVIARLDDEVTVKRYQRRKNLVRLLPENPAFKPIEVNLATQALVIEGISVGVIRRQV